MEFGDPISKRIEDARWRRSRCVASRLCDDSFVVRISGMNRGLQRITGQAVLAFRIG